MYTPVALMADPTASPVEPTSIDTRSSTTDGECCPDDACGDCCPTDCDTCAC